MKYTLDDLCRLLASFAVGLIMISLLTLGYAALAEATTIEEAVYHEARGEPLAGQVAVALVILNRIDSDMFPDTAKGVIEQTKPVCQFSFFCEGKTKIKNIKAFEVAKKAVLIARNMKYSGLVNFPALFYKADYSPARWDKELLAVVGKHQFYK